MTRDVDHSYRTLLIVWMVLLLSQFMFIFVLSQAKPAVFQSDPSAPILGPNAPFVIGLGILAVVNLIVSHIIRARCLEQAVVEQRLQLVQTGVVIGCAFCEAISIFGMLLAFLFDYKYFYLWFALGILGILSHFPRKKHLEAASFKA